MLSEKSRARWRSVPASFFYYQDRAFSRPRERRRARGSPTRACTRRSLPSRPRGRSRSAGAEAPSCSRCCKSQETERRRRESTVCSAQVDDLSDVTAVFHSVEHHAGDFVFGDQHSLGVGRLSDCHRGFAAWRRVVHPRSSEHGPVEMACRDEPFHRALVARVMTE